MTKIEKKIPTISSHTQVCSECQQIKQNGGFNQNHSNIDFLKIIKRSIRYYMNLDKLAIRSHINMFISAFLQVSVFPELGELPTVFDSFETFMVFGLLSNPSIFTQLTLAVDFLCEWFYPEVKKL